MLHASLEVAQGPSEAEMVTMKVPLEASEVELEVALTLLPPLEAEVDPTLK